MIEQLTNKQQRLLAAGLLCCVAVIFYMLAVMPVIALASGYRESIEDLEFELQRYKMIAAGKETLLERAKTIKRHQESSKHFSTRESPALASADLQQFVKQTVVDAGGQLTSTQVVPAQEEGPFIRIALMVRMSGNMDVLQSVLYAIETDRPLLIIENLNIRPIRGRRNRKTRKIQPSDQLNANFEVKGYMHAVQA